MLNICQNCPGLPHLMKTRNFYVIAAISAFLLLLAKPALGQPINYQPYVFTPYAGPSTISTVDGTNSDARFYFPQSALLDGTGNLYVTEASTIRKVTPAGVVTTIAGVPGMFGTNDGPGATARFNTPIGMVIDTSNNLFVADSVNCTIRKIYPSKLVTNFAGQPGVAGTANGSGGNARFSFPAQLTIDSVNNIYVADQGNHCIRMITPNATVATIVGTPGFPGSTDGSQFTSKFNSPAGIAIRSNLVFVADTGNHTIRVFAAGGSAVATVAGLAGNPGSVDGTGSAARFRSPYALAVDRNTNIFVADYGNRLIRKVTAAGVVTTIGGTAGVSGALDGPANTALFNLPVGIAVSVVTGTLYVAEYGNCDIRTISAGTVATLAGLPGTTFTGANDDVASAARFWSPFGIAAAASGNVYVADTSNNTIRKITPDGNVTTFAGTPGVQGAADSTNVPPLFRLPYGIAADSNENIYVADEGNSTIRKIASDGTVSTFAGLARSFGSADGTNSTARFSFPTDVGLDPSNNIYVVDAGNYTIRKITPDGVVTTVAGKAGQFGSTDGTNSSARFNSPWGVAVDSKFNVFVSDRGNGTIRKITQDTTVTTFAGLAGSGVGFVDGIGTNARFSLPTGLAIDKADNLYVSDSYYGSYTIRKITPDGTVTTLGGAPGAFGLTGGAGANARLNQPFAIAVDPNGTLFIADTSNHAIRRAVPLALQLSSQTTTVTLTWPTGSGCLLEHSVALGENWSPVADPAETNNTTISVSQPIIGQNYYRLRTP